MPPVLIYSTPGCQACRISASQFDAKGVTYEMIKLHEQPERADDIASLGYSQAPVVVVPNDPAYGDMAGQHWSGLRPDLIGALAA